MTANEIEISSRFYRRLACVQNAGHYAGVAKPRIVIMHGSHYAVKDDNAYGRVILRYATPADYAVPAGWSSVDTSHDEPGDRFDGLG